MTDTTKSPYDGPGPTPKAAEEIEEFRLHLLAHKGQTVNGCRFCAERTRKASQRVLNRDREAVIGSVIRRACEYDVDRERFYLTHSIGEVALRAVIALEEDADA